jgi:uncharacterized repeat protein (TIGR04042 family)
MRFSIRWPDGMAESCYSPSLVVKDYLTPGESYLLADFLTRSRMALSIASDRVQAKYGRPCALARAQLARIEAGCQSYIDLDGARVGVEAFEE